jgi:hypothetical protein
MNSTELQSLITRRDQGVEAQVSLRQYVTTVLKSLLAAAERHQASLDKDYPEKWSGTVQGEGHVADLFDHLDRFSLTADEIQIRTWECFRSEFDYKDDSFPRAIFDETDPAKRDALIDAHFMERANKLRAEYQRERKEEEDRRRQSYEDLKAEFGEKESGRLS